MTPNRLQADSEEVLIADRWVFLISVCTDIHGRPYEVVLKARDKAGKDGSDTATMAADLGIAISRMLQGRHAGGSGPEVDTARKTEAEG
jgi:hypothetical protein